MINQDILDAINKNLAGEVGSALRQRLEQADKAEQEVKDLKRSLQYEIDAKAGLKTQLDKHAVLSEREVKIAERELKVREREIAAATIDIRENCANMRINDMKEIVLAVFANGKYKYQEVQQTTQHLQTTPGCYPQQFTNTDTKKIETEGSPNGG